MHVVALVHRSYRLILYAIPCIVQHALQARSIDIVNAILHVTRCARSAFVTSVAEASPLAAALPVHTICAIALYVARRSIHTGNASAALRAGEREVTPARSIATAGHRACTFAHASVVRAVVARLARWAVVAWQTLLTLNAGESFIAQASAIPWGSELIYRPAAVADAVAIAVQAWQAVAAPKTFRAGFVRDSVFLGYARLRVFP